MIIMKTLSFLGNDPLVLPRSAPLPIITLLQPATKPDATDVPIRMLLLFV